MIAVDTNIIVRIAVQDDPEQAEQARTVIEKAEAAKVSVLIPTEVIVETVWVLESVYDCTRQEVAGFLEALTDSPVFEFDDLGLVRRAVFLYSEGADFADEIIIGRAKDLGADRLYSFDRDLQGRHVNFVLSP